MLKNNRNVVKIAIAILALFTVQATCGGVEPTDERIQPVAQVQILDQGLYLYTLSITDENLPPPRIIAPESPFRDSGEVVVSGYSVTRSQLESRNFPNVSSISTQAKVRVYELALAGTECDSSMRFAPAKLLGEVDLNDSGKWELTAVLSSNTYIAATVFMGNQESSLGNIVEIIDVDQIKNIFFPKEWVSNHKEWVSNPNKIENLTIDQGRGEFLPYTFSGNGIPGWCVKGFYSNAIGKNILWQASLVNEKGVWELQVPIASGENKIILEVYSPGTNGEYIAQQEFLIKGSNVSYNVLWPFGDKKPDGTYSANYSYKITAWFGPNDYHWKHDPITRGFHDGLDISAATGTPVHAIADGCIYQIRKTRDNGGWAVFIDHGAWASYYYHLQINSIPKKYLSVSEKPLKGKCPETSKVKAGDEIGRVGELKHLHITAFFWRKKDRNSTLSDPVFESDIKGRLINLNPARLDKLIEGKTGSDVLSTCAGTGFWINVDWSKIPIAWGEGTSFNILRQKKNESNPETDYWKNCLKIPKK